MKINTINEFKKFLNENNSQAEARNIFMGVLGESLIQQIESTFKANYGIIENNYYIQLSNQQGVNIDRIVYHPSGEMNSGTNEWWTANSTTQENSLSFQKYNELAAWFNENNEQQLPLLNL